MPGAAAAAATAATSSREYAKRIIRAFITKPPLPCIDSLILGNQFIGQRWKDVKGSGGKCGKLALMVKKKGRVAIPGPSCAYVLL
jgi:hypothetical protein